MYRHVKDTMLSSNPTNTREGIKKLTQGTGCEIPKLLRAEFEVGLNDVSSVLNLSSKEYPWSCRTPLSKLWLWTQSQNAPFYDPSTLAKGFDPLHCPSQQLINQQ